MDLKFHLHIQNGGKKSGPREIQSFVLLGSVKTEFADTALSSRELPQSSVKLEQDPFENLVPYSKQTRGIA